MTRGTAPMVRRAGPWRAVGLGILLLVGLFAGAGVTSAAATLGPPHMPASRYVLPAGMEAQIPSSAPAGGLYERIEVVATVPVGVSPDEATYDPVNGFVYVANQNESTSGTELGPSSISVLNGTSDIATIQLGGIPEPSAVDTQSGVLYVPNYKTGDVTLINGSQVIGSVGVGATADPSLAAFDPADGDIYVADSNSSNVSVIRDSALVATIPVGSDPLGLTYDPVDGDVYVSNENSGNVSVLNGTVLVGTVTTGGYPFLSAFDSANGYVYVPIAYGNVSVISGTTLVTTLVVGAPSTADTFAATYDPRNECVYISDDPGSVTVINGSTLVATIPVHPAPNQPVYDPANGDVFVVSPFPSTVDVINGTQVVETVPVGQAAEAATFDGDDSSLYVVNSWSNSVSVLRLAPAYTVTFEESGLPPGTNWTVDFAGGGNSSLTDSVGFYAANGTFDFDVSPLLNYTAMPASGTVLVNGTALRVSIAWTPVQYLVTFSEGGLPPGTAWAITLNGTLGTSSASYIEFVEPDGNYTYTVGTVTGYSASPASGTVPVNGQSASATVTFSKVVVKEPTPPRYNVTFSETGLPQGTTWAVSFNGTSQFGDGNITFTGFRNGTYPYSVESVSGYGSQGAGNVTIAGHSLIEPVVYVAPTPNGSSNPPGGGGATVLGLPPGEGYGLIGGLVALLVVAGAVVIVWRRRTPPPQDPASSEPPTE